MSILEEYYANKNEDERFSSQHGKVEFLTTMEYLNRYLYPGSSILEIGAGTGAYSLRLAMKGYNVTAVDLLDKHVSIMKEKANKNGIMLRIESGNAVSLAFDDSSFDSVLLLGPMYHLFSKVDQRNALKEAVRVCKPSGTIFVAYCLQDATIFNFLFREKYIDDYKNDSINRVNYSLINREEEVSNLYRIPDIDNLLKNLDVTLLNRVASDGVTNYAKADIDALTRQQFDEYMQWHLATCERADMLGCSHHLLDVLRKAFY